MTERHDLMTVGAGRSSRVDPEEAEALSEPPCNWGVRLGAYAHRCTASAVDGPLPRPPLLYPYPFRWFRSTATREGLISWCVRANNTNLCCCVVRLDGFVSPALKIQCRQTLNVCCLTLTSLKSSHHSCCALKATVAVMDGTRSVCFSRLCISSQQRILGACYGLAIMSRHSGDEGSAATPF